MIKIKIKSLSKIKLEPDEILFVEFAKDVSVGDICDTMNQLKKIFPNNIGCCYKEDYCKFKVVKPL